MVRRFFEHFGQSSFGLLKPLFLFVLGIQLSGIPLLLLSAPEQGLVSIANEQEDPKPIEDNNTADFFKENKILIDNFSLSFFLSGRLPISIYNQLFITDSFARLELRPPRLV